MTIQSFKPTALIMAINIALFTSMVTNAEEVNNIINTENTEENLPETTLDPITVVANIEQADGPVQGIAASTVSSTTGFDEPILKSTQSVTVVGQQEIDTIGAKDINQAFGYSSGFTVLQPSDKTLMDYIVRGFRNYSGSYRDGQKYQANPYNGQQEIYGLERIEVIKGPASVLSGTLPPGGVISATSKKPFFVNAYEVNAEVGSFNRKQISTDLNHKVNDKLAVRLVGVYRDSDTFIDSMPDDRTYIAPSLKWQPNEDTSITLKADYQHDLTQFVWGLPAEGTLYSTNNGKIDRSFNQGVEGFNKYDNTRYTLGYDIEHQMNPDLLVKHSLQYMDADIEFPNASGIGLVDGSNTVFQRDSQKRWDKSEQLTGNLVAAYDWTTSDNIKNVSLFGLDYAKQEHSSERYNGTATDLDFFNPDRSQDAVGDKFEPYEWSWIGKSKQMGAYLQNQTTINDKWVALLGARYDKVTLNEREFFDPSQIYEDSKHNAVTGRAGLVYLMDNGVAPYASINQSFEVNYGKDRNGELFDPTKGTQYEAGVRYQPEGSDTLLTGSVYRIDQTNVLVTDPEDDNFETQLGEVRSQGLELEAKTQVGNNANLIAAYTYTDARTTKASPLYPEDEGIRLGNVPYNKFSIWGDYRFTDFGLPRLKVGTGIRYTGSAAVDYQDFLTPSYTLVDAMASYDWNENLKLSLHAQNLLDKEYVICTYYCFYGEPRNVVGKVTYRW